MTETIAPGTWVEIHAIVLAPGQRPPQVPEDTQKVPLEMRVRGFLLGEARVGDPAEIRTLAGRRLSGALRAVNPGYDHGFGPPVAALAGIAGQVRPMLGRADDGP